jgi:hypothetical protein
VTKSIVTFTLAEDQERAANALARLSGRVELLGFPLEIELVRLGAEKGGLGFHVPLEVFSQRYDAVTNTLDLSNFLSDPGLVCLCCVFVCV